MKMTMTMNWGNALGIYLVVGTAFYGLGWMVQARWAQAGKSDRVKGAALYLGTILGILLWPVFLVSIPVIWRIRRKSRRMEKILGYCEHATALEPYCGPCSRQMKRDEESRAVRGTLVRLRSMEAGMDRTCKRAVEAYLKEKPACPGCEKTGTLEQYMNSVWVKCSACGRRVFTPSPSLPQEIDGSGPKSFIAVGGSCYDCCLCGARFEGFPSGTASDGRPLCGTCKTA